MKRNGIRRWAAALWLAVLPLLGAAQFGEPSGQLRFRERSWDFGKIKEADGPVSHTFEFTNIGKRPFIITSVSASCGCTAPECDKSPVMPGRTRKIKVTFDPRNRPGYFDKAVYISSDNNRKTDIIRVKGTVIPRPRTVQDEYPVILREGLRASAPGIRLDLVPNGRSHTQVIGLYNSGAKPVRLAVRLEKGTPHAGVRVSPELLQPKSKGQILFTLGLEGRRDVWGNFSDLVRLTADGTELALPLRVRGTVTDNFADLYRGRDMARAPRSAMRSQFCHFGKVKASGGTLTHTFEIANEGDEDLVIRKAEPDRDRIAYSLDKTVVPKGGKAVLKLTLDPQGASGRISRKVTLVLNDPLRPVREVRVVADVQPDRSLTN